MDRLSFEVIYVPPLRERLGDVLLLADYFAGRMAYELGWEQVPRISREAGRALEAYDWPGNVRELKNVIEPAVYKSPTPEIQRISFNPFVSPWKDRLGDGGTGEAGGDTGQDAALADAWEGAGIGAGLLPASGGGGDGNVIQALAAKPLKEAVGLFETYRLQAALATCRFNQKEAAAHLGLTYDQFRGLKKKHGL